MKKKIVLFSSLAAIVVCVGTTQLSAFGCCSFLRSPKLDSSVPESLESTLPPLPPTANKPISTRKKSLSDYSEVTEITIRGIYLTTEEKFTIAIEAINNYHLEHPEEELLLKPGNALEFKDRHLRKMVEILQASGAIEHIVGLNLERTEITKIRPILEFRNLKSLNLRAVKL